MLIGNRKLQEKWNEHENLLMSKKLQNSKSRINSTEPKMFRNYKSYHKQGEFENFTDFCKRMNDLNLFRKLEEIYTGRISKSDLQSLQKNE